MFGIEEIKKHLDEFGNICYDSLSAWEIEELRKWNRRNGKVLLPEQGFDSEIVKRWLVACDELFDFVIKRKIESDTYRGHKARLYLLDHFDWDRFE